MNRRVSYRVRNWKDYNRALINRGNLTLWVSEGVKAAWYCGRHQSRAGRRRCYSDGAIEAILTVRVIYGLTLRAVQGFFEGFLVGFSIPHYSQLSRRAKSLEIEILRMRREGKAPTDLVIDSTGLKVYGEGEWKIRTHGKDKRRTWRKYHVSVDPKTHEVVAQELTVSNVHDCTQIEKLLSSEAIGKVYADGAYPGKSSMDAIAIRGGTPVIPPRTGTCIVKNPSPGEHLRNELVRERRKLGGKKAWKKASGYHRRSLVETHMFRLKTILGGTLKSRTFVNQKVEARIMANVLNKMVALGMPRSEKILLNL
jgi:transposase